MRVEVRNERCSEVDKGGQKRNNHRYLPSARKTCWIKLEFRPPDVTTLNSVSDEVIVILAFSVREGSTLGFPPNYSSEAHQLSCWGQCLLRKCLEAFSYAQRYTDIRGTRKKGCIYASHAIRGDTWIKQHFTRGVRSSKPVIPRSSLLMYRYRTSLVLEDYIRSLPRSRKLNSSRRI